MLVSYSVYFSALKMEAICSSETSVDTQRITRRHIPEYGTLHVNIHLVRSLHEDQAGGAFEFYSRGARFKSQLAHRQS
jgi:hypothetical protein